MKPSTLQQKASALLALDARRKAHHYALSKLHASPVNPEKTWQCKSGHITKSIHKPDVCRKCKEEITDLWLSSFREVPPAQEEHETRGLSMWRRLKRLESEARQQTTAQNNGKGLAPGYFQAFCDRITADVAKVFGGTLPDGFFINTDGRGHALKLNCDKTVIPDSMPRDMGGDGILAADISL